MLLPLALVVTISWEPSGEKAIWPGGWVNCGVAEGSRPSERWEPEMGTRRSKTTLYSWTEPPSSALRTDTRSPWTATLSGNAPPEVTTWRRLRWSSRTDKIDTVLLPAFRAYNRPWGWS